MITAILILLCTMFSLYAWTSPHNLAFSGSALFNGDYYTLVSGLFVHANLVHLLGNMVFLFIFGNMLENEVGNLRTGAVFFAGGILSFVLSIPFYPDSIMVGASAAIFAVMAALLLVRPPAYSLQFLSPMGPLVIVFLIFNVVAIENGASGNVAYISHVIGFVIGLFFGASWNKKWMESLLYTLGLLVIYFVLYNYLKTVV
ncbi:MAG: rhomboid family intramembrane serine protease [Candidatus Methanoperedens sp.]|nr:rhomboid family intramembrane serine protease [Candidatus Methanoperedens sp.]